ncbi:glycosyltransferase family 2 protein [Mucilaginibacter sp.]|uniref:glycosyltransferase family 2 protein n=1 Tax=Mucilaginibacter sp. TaxID=1882438 RepID=UPI0026339604|nr:glycosyltransferase family 2 protein [Mucilaginibacter sp.]MDB4919613.1 glycosyltransferase [Mucilaginibacter sp.]
MRDLKISLITVVHNAENTITSCIDSVIRQNFKNVEHIIIDGGSTDGTVQLIEKYRHYLSHFVSEPDKGIYDAMNKGIRLATGHIVGMLNADDFFADENVLSTVAAAFEKNNADILYGDLDYINKKGRAVRKWRSGEFKRRNFNFGWMPPHPTFYCKRDLFEKFGLYSLDYGTAADYELMVRFLYVNKLAVFYIKKVLVKMKLGGKSNKTYSNRIKGLLFDLKAMRDNHIKRPVIALIVKPIRKVNQYF